MAASLSYSDATQSAAAGSVAAPAALGNGAGADGSTGNESISTFGSIGLQAPLPGRAALLSPPDESEEARIQARLAAAIQPMPGVAEGQSTAALTPLINPLAMMYNAGDTSVLPLRQVPTLGSLSWSSTARRRLQFSCPLRHPRLWMRRLRPCLARPGPLP